MRNRQKPDRKRTADKGFPIHSKRQHVKNGLLIIRFLLTTAALAGCVFLWKGMRLQADLESFPFTESSRELRNPNRGFYCLYTFWINEEETDYQQLVKESYYQDKNTELTQIQICLQAYREGPISKKGLADIEALLCAVEAMDRQLIVRFLYDTDGQGEQHEPPSLEIILQHMRQLQPILTKKDRHIFLVQGLFTGNWGEMNGTRYDTDEDLQRLAEQLASAAAPSTYLGVRTPAQWRRIMASERLKNVLDGRLCLYNDGMLGNESDYGTYRPENVIGEDVLGRKYPQEELDFQKELCRSVPNGGEVIDSNPYNDFVNAVAGLKERRVTYLNRDYDQAVMDKWKDAVWEGGDCFQGMDGYSYIERHLGYRLLIENTDLKYNQRKNCIEAEVGLKNAGFAPMYKEPRIKLILYSEKDGQRPPIEMKCEIRKLAGAEEAEAVETAHARISLEELERGEYEVYFRMEDPDTGKVIQMANEEDAQEYGYAIGRISLHYSNSLFEKQGEQRR